MRKQCNFCTLKHLSQAMVLMDEAKNGYPIHKWLAIGHMAEAESEGREYAEEIREIRTNYMENIKEPNLLPLMERIESELRSMDKEEYSNEEEETSR